MSVRASSRVNSSPLLPLLLGRLRISCRECHPIGLLAIEADLEGVLSRTRKGNIEHQHRPGLDVDHSGRRLPELHRALSPEELIPILVDEPDANGVNADFGPSASHPQDEVSARVDGGKVGQPDVLKHAQHAELALLVDQGVVGDDGEVEVQLS
jgi:hypothetical protein